MNNGCFKKGVRHNPETEFKKGHIPWNVRHHEEFLEKLKSPRAHRMKLTQFKKGNQPHNWKPVGTISIRKHDYKESKPAYKYIKIKEPNVWMKYHNYIWEKENGKISKSHIIRFINGDSMDCRLENLRLIDRAQNARLNSNYNTDKYIATIMARKRGKFNGEIDKKLRNHIMKYPELIEFKRTQLKIKRTLNDRKRNKSYQDQKSLK